MPTSEHQPDDAPVTAPATPLGRLVAVVRQLHAAGWTFDRAHGEYRRGGDTLTPGVLYPTWASVVLYRDRVGTDGRARLAQVGWVPGDTSPLRGLVDLIAGAEAPLPPTGVER